jgi:hypothetical protein
MADAPTICTEETNTADSGRKPSDVQLLERYRSRRDGASFAALVERHRGTVWRVCRRVLRQEQDAEDAFQAVFEALLMELRRPSKASLEIKVNDRQLLSEDASGNPPGGFGSLSVSPWSRTFDLKGIDLGDEVVVEILSNTLVPRIETSGRNNDERPYGVQVRGVKLLREKDK